MGAQAFADLRKAQEEQRIADEEMRKARAQQKAALLEAQKSAQDAADKAAAATKSATATAKKIAATSKPAENKPAVKKQLSTNFAEMDDEEFERKCRAEAEKLEKKRVDIEAKQAEQQKALDEKLAAKRAEA